MVQEKLGSGWERIIRDTSRQGSEQTLIYMQPEGTRMGLFVVALDEHELNVIEVSVDPTTSTKVSAATAVTTPTTMNPTKAVPGLLDLETTTSELTRPAGSGNLNPAENVYLSWNRSRSLAA